MVNNVFYFWHINEIGGIESFFYNLVKKYKDYDITIYYKTGDIGQINRLKEYVRVKRYIPGTKIECKRAFFNFNLEIIDNVKAEEYIQIIHGDYKAMGIVPPTHEKITKYIGVSKNSCESFKEVTGKDIELVYNPIEVEKPNKVLRLISATRLTKEKGLSRIEKLAHLMEEAKIPYIWEIFTDDTGLAKLRNFKSDNVLFIKSRLNIQNHVSDADYLVQLSDNEGYCYSVVESLMLGTPVIVTNCPVYKELGLNSKNSFILDFDLNNVPLAEIQKGLPKFQYRPKKDTWDKQLVEGKSTYYYDKDKLVKVIAIYKPKYFDIEKNMYIEKGTEFETKMLRAEHLEELGVAKIIR